MYNLGKPRLNDLNPTIPPERPPLGGAYFARDTLEVARALLGTHLMSFHPAIGEWLRFRVVETEAYTANDPACHAYNRKAGRAEMLYAKPGTAYVYLIYGMYNCLNVVTEPEDTAGAVLFRALEPLSLGQSEALPAAPKTANPWGTHGPGRLTRALGITRATHNGIPLTKTEGGLYLTAGEPIADADVIQTTRIGITKAIDYPWRFYIKDNPWVSVK